jgi:hypothetical protein
VLATRMVNPSHSFLINTDEKRDRIEYIRTLYILFKNLPYKHQINKTLTN